MAEKSGDEDPDVEEETFIGTGKYFKAWLLKVIKCDA